MVIGAGNAGQAIIRDIKRAKEIDDWVSCVIDDDPNKWGRYIEGVKVVGGRDTILENKEDIFGYPQRDSGAEKRHSQYLQGDRLRIKEPPRNVPVCKRRGYC